AKGQDTGSLITDPTFIAPEKDDFTLRSNTAAQRIGFVPFDLSNVGPRGGHHPYRFAPPAFPITHIAPNPPHPACDDFEKVPVGSKPGGAGTVINEETSVPAASIRVTDETA